MVVLKQIESRVHQNTIVSMINFDIICIIIIIIVNTIILFVISYYILHVIYSIFSGTIQVFSS